MLSAILITATAFSLSPTTRLARTEVTERQGMRLDARRLAYQFR